MSAVYETTLRLNCRFRKLDPCVSTEEPTNARSAKSARCARKARKLRPQRQISARQLSGMSGIFLRTGRDLGDCTGWLRRQSAANQSPTKFPANRENNREFCRIRPSTAVFESDQRAHSIVYSRIPCVTEQGISKRVSGKIFQGTGNRYAICKRPFFARLFCACRTRSVLTRLFAKVGRNRWRTHGGLASVTANPFGARTTRRGVKAI
jgi:hypothetical protein